MRKIERISISVADRERLERLVKDRNTPQKVVWRARIVLLAGDGLTAEGIAAAVVKSLLTVRRWRRRYVAKGVDGLVKDATRRSRVKPLTPEQIRQVVDMTLHEKPPNATHRRIACGASACSCRPTKTIPCGRLGSLRSCKRLRTWVGLIAAMCGRTFGGPVMTLIGYERSHRNWSACNPTSS